MSWPTVKLGDVAKFINGGTPSKEITEYWSGYTAWISSADIVEDAIQKPRHYISDIAIQKSSTNIVPANTLLVVTRTGVGKLAITTEPLCFSQDITAVILREHCDINFVAKSIKSQTNSLVAQARGATIKGITRDVLESLLIPLPPLAEQKRIAAILDKADEIKRKREQAIAKLDQLAQSIFVEMFGNIANNDKGWELQKLSKLSTFENGDRSSNYPSGDDLKDTGILFLSTKNIVNSKLDLNTTNFITEEKFNSLSRGKAKLNDLIITLRGTLGSCCIFDCKQETAFINAQMMIIRPQESILSIFLHAFLTSSQSKKYLLNIGNGAAVPQLTSKQFADLLLPLPPLALQEQFATRISKLEKLKASNIAALEKHNQLFASLQNQAFTGQL